MKNAANTTLIDDIVDKGKTGISNGCIAQISKNQWYLPYILHQTCKTATPILFNYCFDTVVSRQLNIPDVMVNGCVLYHSCHLRRELLLNRSKLPRIIQQFINLTQRTLFYAWTSKGIWVTICVFFAQMWWRPRVAGHWVDSLGTRSSKSHTVCRSILLACTL